MDRRTVQLGFYASLVAFAAALGYSVVQILQIVGAIRYPLDAIVIYSFSLFIATPYVLAFLPSTTLPLTAGSCGVMQRFSLQLSIPYM